ncbi:MAG: hypothetical protein JST51_18000 [Armatimonadetes bacterium]|nr:hypothetical protein [Armatimonadota bacterium]
MLLFVDHDRKAKTLKLTMRCGNFQVGYYNVEVTYEGAHLTSRSNLVLNQIAQTTRGEHDFMHDIHFHEVAALKGGRICHRYLFNPGIQFAIMCRSLTWIRDPRDDRQFKSRAKSIPKRTDGEHKPLAVDMGNWDLSARSIYHVHFRVGIMSEREIVENVLKALTHHHGLEGRLVDQFVGFVIGAHSNPEWLEDHEIWSFDLRESGQNVFQRFGDQGRISQVVKYRLKDNESALTEASDFLEFLHFCARVRLSCPKELGTSIALATRYVVKSELSTLADGMSIAEFKEHQLLLLTSLGPILTAYDAMLIDWA